MLDGLSDDTVFKNGNGGLFASICSPVFHGKRMANFLRKFGHYRGSDRWVICQCAHTRNMHFGNDEGISPDDLPQRCDNIERVIFIHNTFFKVASFTKNTGIIHFKLRLLMKCVDIVFLLKTIEVSVYCQLYNRRQKI